MRGKHNELEHLKYLEEFIQTKKEKLAEEQQEFLILHPYENNSWNIYNNTNASPADISKKLLSTKVHSIESLIDDLFADTSQSAFSDSFEGLDDFELISFIAVVEA